MSSNDTMQTGRSKATPAQLSYLAEYMRTHGDMASGFGQNLEGRVQLERAWERLAVELNALGGCTKTASKWKQTWRDLRNNVKKRASHNRAEYRGCGTGNGPPTLNPMGPIEEQVLSVIGPVAVFGMEDIVATEALPPPTDLRDVSEPGPSMATGPSPTPTATPRTTPPRKRRRTVKPIENLDLKLLKIKEEELRLRAAELEVKREKNQTMNRLVNVLQEISNKMHK